MLVICYVVLYSLIAAITILQWILFVAVEIEGTVLFIYLCVWC